MGLENLEAILCKAVRLGVALTLFIPLALLGYFGIAPSDGLSRVFVLQAIIEVVAVFYFWLVLLDKKYLPQKSALLVALSIFFLLQVLAGIFGIHPPKSFFGDIGRGDSIIFQAHLLVLFVILAGTFKTEQSWMSLFKISVIVSSVTSFASLLQKMHLVKLYNVEGIRVSGTMVNPNLFGNYIALSIFIALFVALSEKNRRLKVVWYLILAFDVWALFASGTRGAFAGTIAGFCVIFLIYIPTYITKLKNTRILGTKKKIGLFALIFLPIIFAATLFYLAITFRHTFYFTGRIYDIVSLSLDPSRRAFWSIAISAFWQRPWLGWGYNSFGFIWAKNFDGLSYALSHYNLLVDRPHNKVLEILLWGGIFGLLVYFSVFFIALFYLKKQVSLGRREMIIWLGFLTCYFVENLFLFDSPSKYILFCLTLAYVSYLHLQKFAPTTSSSASLRKLFPAGGIVAMLFAGAMAIIFYQLNIRPVQACLHFRAGNTSYTVAGAISEYRKALSMSTVYDNDLRRLVLVKLRNMVDFDSRLPQDSKHLALNFFLGEKAHVYSALSEPREGKAVYYAIVEDILPALYLDRQDPKYLEELEQINLQAIAFNPKNPLSYQSMAELKILQNKDEEGLAYAERMYALLSENSTHLRMKYLLLSKSYYEKKDFTKAFSYIVDFMKLDLEAKSQDRDDMYNVNGALIVDKVTATYYQESHDVAGTKKVYEEALKAYPMYKKLFTDRLQKLVLQRPAVLVEQ